MAMKHNGAGVDQATVLAEYAALRQEIVTRIGLRHQMMVIAITLLGLLMAFGVNEKEISIFLFLLYPVLCAFFAVGWTHSDVRISELGAYIGRVMEPKLVDMGWERYIKARSHASKQSFRGQEKSALGVFVGAEVFALLIAGLLQLSSVQSAAGRVWIQTHYVLKLLILLIALAAIAYTVQLIRTRRHQADLHNAKALMFRREAVVADAALQSGARGSRKVLVTQVYAASEQAAEDTQWRAPVDGDKCPVQHMLDTEVSHFNQYARQDRHYHKLATEMYMVLEGNMVIDVDRQVYSLSAGDMVVVNPGVVHEVKPDKTTFLCRVVTVNCMGVSDKYVL